VREREIGTEFLIMNYTDPTFQRAEHRKQSETHPNNTKETATFCLPMISITLIIISSTTLDVFLLAFP
jgi:hypothetical protein